MTVFAAELLTREEARSILTVLGALLAAYGFFYSGVKDSLAEAASIDWTRFRDQRAVGPSLTKAVQARNVLFLLAACPLLIGALFVPVAVDVVVDIDWTGTYAPEKAALLLIVGFWVSLAAVMLRRAIQQAKDVQEVRKKAAELPVS